MADTASVSDEVENPFEDINAEDVTQEDIDEWCIESPTAESEGKGVLSASDGSDGGRSSGPALVEHPSDNPTDIIPAVVNVDAPTKQVEDAGASVVQVASTSNPGSAESSSAKASASPLPSQPPGVSPAPASTSQLKEPNKSSSPAVVAATPIVKHPVAEIEPQISLPSPSGTSDKHHQTVDEQEQVQQEEQNTQQQGGWGRWSGGWGLQAISGKLKEVAVGAVKDVRELTGSFQQALAQVESDSEAENEGDTQAVPGAGPSMDQPPLPMEVETRDQINGKEADDEEVEVGLKAIDHQVEQLATGAAQALTSLWGGLSGVARNTLFVGQNLASKVEAVTKDLARDLSAGVHEDVQQLHQAATSSVKGVAGSVSKIGSKLERGLETVGRTALGILEEVTGQYHTSPATRDSAALKGEPSSFDDFFYLYGGQQLCDELEALANECARISNKSRSKLEASQQEALDATLAALGPIFACSPSTLGGLDHLHQQSQLDGANCQAALDQLEQRYEPIKYLCSDSQARAESFKNQLLEALQNSSRAPASKDGVDGSRGGGNKQPADGMEDVDLGSMASEVKATVASEGIAEGSTVADSPGESAVVAVLAQLKPHAAKRLAELCTAQVQQLYNSGASIAAPARSGHETDAGIPWPEESQKQALLLQTYCSRMVQDLAAVSQAYQDTISTLLDATAESKPDDAGSSSVLHEEEREALGALANSLIHELKAASQTGATRTKEGYRGLLYVVLVRELVTRIAQ